MASYDIKKTNNGEYKEIEKTFVLDVNRFRANSDTLVFKVEGEENPVVFDLEVFKTIMVSQINQGFMESLEYKDGLLIATTRDVNTIKRYTYDFGWNRFKDLSSGEKNALFDGIEKHFVLDINKFKANQESLCFNAIEEEFPIVFNLSVFVNNIINQIDRGLMENLDYNDGVLTTITRDGNIVKRYSYDFGLGKDKSKTKKEYEEIEKLFVLDVDKYRGHGDTLVFRVEGEDNPVIYDLPIFANNLISDIDKGLVESFEFKDGLLSVVTNDGKTIKRYTYDLGLNRTKEVSFGIGSNNSLEDLKNLVIKILSYYNENPNKSLDELQNLIFKLVSYYKESPNNSIESLKTLIFKIVSCYNENPNREIIARQKYIRMIFDIMDGDRMPVLENKEEVLRVFQTYHAYIEEILSVLLGNVIFYDDNGNVLEYRPYLRKKKLEMIKNDVFTQMQIKMLMFAATNDANDIYQEYNENVFIEPVQIAYKYVDENGNEVEPPIEEVGNGTILSLGREMIGKGFASAKDLALNGASFVAEKASEVLQKVREHKRTGK